MKRALNYMVGMVACCCIALPGVTAQERKIRTVGQAVIEGPVELVDVNVEGQTAKPSDKITAGKDWLKSLKLNFKNTYSKNIVYMDVELEIAKTGKMTHPLRLPLTFGRIPESAGQSSNAPEKLRPQGNIRFSLSEETVDFFARFMRENQFDEIEGVTVFVEFIVFDDDTAWSKGHSMRRDTSNPERWIVNGVSEPHELRTLPSLDIARLRLDYKESKRTDGHGNAFRYRAKADDSKGAKANRWAWDVTLIRAQ